MLTPLQQRVARIVARLPESEGFALAGGGAVIVQGIVDRGTDDLDFFGADVAGVARLTIALRSALELEGLTTASIIEQAGFTRLEV